MFASRGYSVDQPLAVITQDLPNTYSDNALVEVLDFRCHFRRRDAAVNHA